MDATSPMLLMAGTEEHDLTRLDEYRAVGGYVALDKARALEPPAVMDEISAATLRGRGGAGFPMGRKASLLAKDTGKPTYLVLNADESEPGAFKDRDVLRNDAAPADRGLPDHRARHRLGDRVHLHPGGVRARVRRHARCARGGTQRRPARRRDDRPASRRGRLHLRRGDRAPRVARGPARAAAPAAAVPAGERTLRRSDSDQQRLDDRARPEDHRARRGRVLQDRRTLRAGNGGLLDLGQCRPARELRAPAR